MFANQEVDADRCHGHAESSASGIGQERTNGLQQRRNHTNAEQQAAQAHAEYHDGLRKEHAFQAAARNQTGNVFKCFAFEFVSAVKPRAQLFQIRRTVEVSHNQRHHNGKQHGYNGIHAHQGKDNQQGKRNQRIGMHQTGCFQLRAESLDAVHVMRGNIGQEPQHQRRTDQPCRHSGVHHVFDVFEQINADNRSGNTGRIGKRRHFIAKERTRHNRTCRHRHIGMKRSRHTHKCHADSRTSRQTTADGNTDDRAERKRREIKISRRNQSETVIHQRRNRTAHHQRADHQADKEKQINRAHALPDRAYHTVLHILIFQAAHQTVQQQDHNRRHNRHMRQPFKRNNRITHCRHQSQGHSDGLKARHIK